MQEQHVRRACGAIAGQIFCVTAGEGAAQAKTGTGTNSSLVLAARVTNAHPSATSAEAKVVTGLDTLQRAYDAVVRHAMTLYRLCRRPGGGAIDIVSVGTSCSGGVGGATCVAEEAAYCVCAAIMALEPHLWASLVRRAQLLRPRKPSFLFVAPVAVPPVVVKDVEKFFRRSRCLMSFTAAPALFLSGISTAAAPPASAAPPSLACADVAAHVPTTSASTSPSATTTTASATAAVGLPARQAEAVAAYFFFKTMTEAEKLRRREVFEVHVEPSRACCAVGAAAATARSVSAAVAPAVGESGAAAVPSSSSKHTSAASAATAAGASELTAGLKKFEHFSGILAATRGGAAAATAAQSDTSRSAYRPPKQSTVSLLPFSSAPSMLFTDGLSSRWGAQQASGSIGRNPLPLSSTRPPASVDGAEGGAEVVGWPGGISSGSSSEGRGSSPRESDRGGQKAAGRRPSTGKADASLDQQAGDADAVLTRLYALALSAEDPAASEPPDAEVAMQPPQGGSGGSGQRRPQGATASVKGSHALFSAAVSLDMLRSDSGLSLVALSAGVAHACDALHWGRLQMLVRYPLLFRTIPPAAEASATVALEGGGEALTVETMARMGGCLGMPYTAAIVLPPTSTAPSDSATGNPDALLPSPASPLSYMSSLYGAAGSIFSPARVHTSSPQLLFPRPPSLVTESFLWARLLICSAWLLVYADGLVSDDCKVGSVEQAQCATGGRGCSDGVRPRVRPTPAVQAIVSYCVAVVREARAMSAGMTAAARSGNDSLSGTVCCPVCDDLINAQHSALRWSTLREDRASLRAQVYAVLESNCVDSDEKGVAGALADHLACEGRGRRQASPLLSGSEGAPCRVAALQQRWGAYIMRGDASAIASRTAAAAGADAREPTSDDREETATAEETLWAALTQRIAAATDFCTFLSAHPTESSVSHPLAAASASCSRPKRHRAERNGGAALEAAHHHRRHGKHKGAQHSAGSGSDDDDEWGDDCRSRAGAAPQGSRHAVEEAEEWSRLLCRCGWANAAPPSGSTSLRMYEAWASSLFLPSAFPTPQQAATLRRRLSRYSLTDIVRKLVLGRGGSWERYARLLFGDDVRNDSTASLCSPPPAAGASAPAAADVALQTMTSPPASLLSPRLRAPSLSLLEEAHPDADSVYISHMRVDPRATHTSSPPRQLMDAEHATPYRASGRAPSPPLPCGTVSSNVDHAIASERWPATPAGKGALLSIPLLVSPLTRRYQMEAVSGAVAAPPPPPLPPVSPADTDFDAANAVSDGAPQERARSVRGRDASSRASATAPLEQLRAQQAALHALLHFRPRLPPLREEDAVLECASCFSLFHQGCIAPVQRTFLGDAFLCHTCRLRWARPCMAAGCGLVHQVPERRHDASAAGAVQRICGENVLV
ncbi:hypothetical protein LSCM1_07971 [Leishmania martiniquensis]|uniref:Uncharacterized protein n=1 Tax=Leishmania martiniquensis TaxID=1580590 RepID=A0A836GRC3_9TRYP|nr:hypothetical protein LSCM1_07971 [Leishmania martiniquensis]